MYLYKVMTNQVPREFKVVAANNIAEAQKHGVVVMMLQKV